MFPAVIVLFHVSVQLVELTELTVKVALACVPPVCLASQVGM